MIYIQCCSLNRDFFVYAVAKTKILKNVGFLEIFSSPLLRARHTAEIVGRSCGIPTIIADELNEVDDGHMGRACYSVVKRKDCGFELEKFNVIPKTEKRNCG